MFQRFKKANPYVGARKLRLIRPPVRRDEFCIRLRVNIKEILPRQGFPTSTYNDDCFVRFGKHEGKIPNMRMNIVECYWSINCEKILLNFSSCLHKSTIKIFAENILYFISQSVLFL